MMTVMVFTGRNSGCLYDGCHSLYWQGFWMAVRWLSQCLLAGIQDVCVMAVTVFTGRDSGYLYDDCHSVYWQGFRMSV